MITIEKNEILKNKLNDICNKENYNGFLSYTKKFKLLNIQKLIADDFYKDKHQFLFENNKSNLELVMMIMGRVSKLVRRLISLPIKSFAAKRWIVNRMKEKRSGSKHKFWPLSKGVA